MVLKYYQVFIEGPYGSYVEGPYRTYEAAYAACASDLYSWTIDEMIAIEGKEEYVEGMFRD